MSGIEIEFDEDALAMLLDDEVTDDMRQRGEAGVADAKRRAPVDDGDLRRDIRVLGVHRERTDVVLQYGSTLDYSEFVERGSGRGDAQPYLRPSLKATE